MAKKSITERIVTKRFINTVEKINEELKAFAEYSEEEEEEEEAEEAAAPEFENEAEAAENAAAKAEEAAYFEAMKKEAEETAEEYARMALGNESFLQCNLSEFDRAEIRYKAAYLRRRAAEYQAKAAEYQAKAEAARKESITNK